ncbi:amidase [Cohaesibacter celericrescens]|uniref:Amidase n=1 Tax=Cohaesibacter celericrescens TaxID=2067669 RepID=A0A2N5XQZ3_9HYPH|nr:amidase [Cohaesibacter celericrescens]PLW76931.1 amidase [Cohaesibacter celericrescens]
MADLWTIAAAQKALREGDVSSVDLVSAAYRVIEKDEGEGARTFVRTFKNAAITQAAASDAMRKMHVPQGPLAGIPISVKDLFDVSGEPTTAGSKALAGVAKPAQQDALVLARLRAAGAIFLGHTNMTEFAYSGLGINPHFGTPLNPWDRLTGRVPGGSSSGAAMSVVENMAIAAIGSDTGGSVRIPAAFNRLYGFKPSFGRHPLDGVFPLGRSLDTVGPIGNSMACCRLIDHLMAGLPVPDADIRPLAGFRFGILETIALDGLDVEVAGGFVRALETISKAGARLERIKVDAINRFTDIGHMGSLVGPEAYHAHRAFLMEYGDSVDPRVRSRIEAAAHIAAADYIEMLDLQKDMQERTHMATRNYDAILMPTVAVVPPEIKPLLASDELYFETNLKVLRNTSIGNLLGRPSASIPVGAEGSVPVGLMIMGEYNQDANVLNIAESIDFCLKS